MPATAHAPASLLRGLGVHGWDALEPVVLAALATESPLLLVGPHGTAKSWLLLRLAQALRLEWRHYNASLISFDDLVGYPLPDAEGKLRFVETPASVWGAGVVFLDEISRCRPDAQNKLFSLVHERRIQGLALPALVHRWAAMNPPPSDDTRAGDDEYLGSEPLDPALADRFPFVLETPSWTGFSEDEQEAAIRQADAPLEPEAAEALRQALERARAELRVVEEAFGTALAEHARLVVPLAATLGLPLSPRRAGMLYRNAVAVHAARLALSPAADLAESAWLALQHSLPHRAQGRRVDVSRLALAHREAWAAVKLDRLDPRRALLAEPDPVRRALKAVALPGLDPLEISAHVADGLAHCRPGARHAFATHVLGSAAAASLTASVAEQVADLHALTVVAQDVNEAITAGSGRHAEWKEIQDVLAQFRLDDPEAALVGNLLFGLFNAKQLGGVTDVIRTVGAWRDMRRTLGVSGGGMR